MTWDDTACQWTVRIRDVEGAERTEVADYVISAVGIFDRPRTPDISGVADFKGFSCHSTGWDDTTDLTGKRIAIVGTGSTALQIAAAASKVALNTTVFQRSPAWMVEWPGVDLPVPESRQWLYDNLPWYLNFERLRTSYALGDRILGKVFDVDPEWHHPISVNADNERLRVQLTAYLERKLAGRPDLFEKLLPNYPPIAKRFVVDAGWLDALCEGRADLVTEAIDHVSSEGIVTRDGCKHPFDIIVYATGFRSNDFLWPMDITGRNGVRLDQIFARDGGRAYMGMMVPDFPNMFIFYGPNSNPRAGTPPMWAEIQMRYICNIIETMVEDSVRAIAVKSDVHDAHQRDAEKILARSVWMDQRQNSYYRNEHNRVAVNSPWKTIEYWRMTRRVNKADYQFD